MPIEPDCGELAIGDWRAVLASGELIGNGVRRLEPKAMDLLFLLATRNGDVVGRDELLLRLWPGLIVGEDTLARAVSRLRKVLGDDPKSPRYIETIAKRGYRCIAIVDAPPAPTAAPELSSARVLQANGTAGRNRFFKALAKPIPSRLRWLGPGMAIVVAAWLAPMLITTTPPATSLTERADDFYMRYTRADNEAAIEIYEQALDAKPDDARAGAGLANALVQRVLRWPHAPGEGIEYTRLGDALDAGTLDVPIAQATLVRAQRLALHATEMAPGDAGAYKSLGLVKSAQRDFDGALDAYRTAVKIDKDAWGPLINISDVLEITGHPADAIAYLEAAHDAMTRVYERQKAQVLPWYASLGVLIGDRHRILGHLPEAEHWYREVLAFAPFQPAATDGLAALLRESSRGQAAAQLCSDQQRRVGRGTQCG